MRHAYLVIAHHQFEILMKTISILDDINNDFYIHIDKKSKDVPFEEILNTAKFSKVYFTNRKNVYWGSYAQIECEIELLKDAVQKKYDYYHLISGVDMPIKSKEVIFEFFEKNKGKEFVHFESPKIREVFLERVKRHYFMDFNNKNIIKVLKVVPKFEKMIGYNRIKKSNTVFQYGWQWFSVTDDLAKYILKNEEWIKQNFTNTFCCDEIFLQTLVENSEFKNKLYLNKYNESVSCLRLIDWQRGLPYTWKKSDIKEILSSQCLFARKFDLNIDSEIIEEIYKLLVGEK